MTKETVRAVCALEVAPEQRGYVAPNAVSIAEAHFEPKAWFRGAWANGEPVGFVMLYEDLEKQEYFLWRLMVGAGHQGKGYGREILDLVADYVRSLPGARYLYSSYVPGDAGPAGFYDRYGFEKTGRVEGGELEIRLALS